MTKGRAALPWNLVAGDHNMLEVLVSAPGKTLADPEGAGSGGWKSLRSIGKKSTAEVLRLRAQALCRTIDL
jgi:hypothetical protein